MSDLCVYRVYPDRNTTLIQGLPTRNTGKNEVMEMWYGGDEPSISPTGVTHIAMYFSLTALTGSLFSYIDSGMVVSYKLKMFDCSSAYRKEPLPGNTTLQAFALSAVTLFSEGDGHDFEGWDSEYVHRYATGETFVHTGYSNWNQVVEGAVKDDIWSGGVSGMALDYSGAAEISRTGDLEMDITDIVSAWTNESISNLGLLLKFTDAVEASSAATHDRGYAKNFHSRHTHTVFKPYIEVTYSGVVGDDRAFLNPRRAYLYTFKDDRLADIHSAGSVSVYSGTGGTAVLENLPVTHISEGVYRADISALTAHNEYYDVWTANYTSSLTGAVSGETFVVSGVAKGTGWSTGIGWTAGDELRDRSRYGIAIVALGKRVKLGDRYSVYLYAKKFFTTGNTVLRDLQYRIVHDDSNDIFVPWTEVSYNQSHNWFYLDTGWFYPDEKYRLEIRQASDGEVSNDTLMKEFVFEVVE